MISRSRAYELRRIIEDAAASLDDATALDGVELFPNWQVGTAYQINTRVRYNNILYKCLQAHTSQSQWNPQAAAALWARVLIPDPDVIPDWIQPDSTNPYMTGDKVKHNNKTWISIVDNNVWEPGVYGWDEVAE